MDSLNFVPSVVAGLSAIILVATLPTIFLVRRLGLPRWATIVCHVATASLILCCALFIAAMLWGIESNWAPGAKAWMMMAWLLTLPAGAGSAAFLVAGVAARRGRAVKAYFAILGTLCFMMFGMPALIFFLMAMPGRP